MSLPVSLLFIGFAAFAAAQNSVPSVNQNSNWGNNGGGGSWGDQNGDSLRQSPSVLVISGKFRQMYLYINEQQLVNPAMTRQQADQKVLDFVRSQSPAQQQMLKRMHNDVNSIADRLGGVMQEGRSVLSNEALQFFRQLDEVNRATGRTLLELDQRTVALNKQYASLTSEIQRFDQQALRIFTQRFGCPQIAGRNLFPELNSQCNTNNNNNNNGCNNNNNNNGNWGNNNGGNNGGWNNGNSGTNPWNNGNNNGGWPSNNNNNGWNNNNNNNNNNGGWTGNNGAAW